MKQNEYLFYLIKSLNKTEKRYIKIQSQFNKGDKSYMRLFNEMEKRAVSGKAYDENELKKIFTNRKLQGGFSVSKNYLNDFVLKNLARFHSEGIADMRIFTMISSALMLHGKALYRQFYKKILAAEEEAVKCERFALALHITGMKKIGVIDKLVLEDSTYINSREMEILDKYKNIIDYNNLVSSLQDIMRMGGPIRDRATRQIVGRLPGIDLLHSEKSALSVSARERFYYANQIYSYLLGNHEGTMEFIVKRYEIITENPRIFKGRLRFFHPDALSNLLQVYIYKNDTKNIKKYFRILGELDTGGFSERIQAKAHYIHCRLLEIPLEKNEKTVNDTLEEAISFFNKYKTRILPETEIFVLSILSFMCLRKKKLNEALEAVNLILQSPTARYRKDVEQYAKIFSGLVHFELGNYEYLQHYAKSLNRYLYRRKRRNKLEALYINLLLNISRLRNKPEIKEYLSIALVKLEKLKQLPFETNSLLYNEIVYWIQRKLKVLG